jgi:hypothetical protein
MKYFYYKNKNLFGPLPLEDLVKVITSKTLVKDDKNEWKLAVEYPEIASKMELLNVYPEQIVIPPLPTKRGTVQPKPNDKDSNSTNPKFPPPLQKSDEPKNADNKKTTSTNNNDHKSTPPTLPQQKNKPQSEGIRPPLTSQHYEKSKTNNYTQPISSNKVPESASAKRSSINTANKPTNGGRKMAFFLLIIGIFAGLFLLKENSKNSSNSRFQQEQSQYNETEDEINDEENSDESPRYNEENSNESPEYNEEERRSIDETTDNTSGNYNETDDNVDAVTNTLIDMLISVKRECKCCGRQFSPSTGYNDEGQSPTLDGSDRCTSGQTEYCSEKCYNKFDYGNCE